MSFLAGTGRRWSNGRAYALSDHFAVYGLLDVHSCHSSSGTTSVREQRRVDLGKQRDALALAEKEVVALEERILRDADWDAQQQSSMKEREAHLRAWRKSVKERRARKLRLRDAVQGSESLFAASLDDDFGKLAGTQPLPHAASTVPAYDGLLCLGGDVAWAEVCGGRPPAKGYRSGVTAIDFAVQCLHRLLPFALWLGRHAELCGDVQTESPECIVCALQRCKQDFGKNLSQTLLLPRFSLGYTVKSGNYSQRDPVEYLVRLLEQLRAREVTLGHVCDLSQCRGAESVSHVDRLFRFLVERRLECLSCKRKSVVFEASWYWRVSVSGFEASEATVQELYLRSCAEVDASCMCVSCGIVQPHRVQKRLASLPNAFIVCVDREGGVGGSVESLPVLAEDYLSFPALGPNLELASVLFQSMRSLCACRCGDGDFWWFDAGRASQCLGQSVCGVMKKNVSVLVYQRSNGEAEFSGGRRDVVVPSRPCQTFGVAQTGADATLARRVQPATVDQSESVAYKSMQDQIAARRAKEQARRMDAAIAQVERERQARRDGVERIATALGARVGRVPGSKHQSDAAVRGGVVSSQGEQWRRETASVVAQSKEARVQQAGSASVGPGLSMARSDAGARMDAGASAKRPLLRRYKGGVRTDSSSRPSGAAASSAASAAAVSSVAEQLRRTGVSTDAGFEGRQAAAASVPCKGTRPGLVSPVGSQQQKCADAHVEKYAMENTILYEELQQLCVPEEIIESILVLMQREFSAPVAYAIAQEEWLRDWGRWAVFAIDVQSALCDCGDDVQRDVYVQESRGLLSSLIFDVFQRVAADRASSRAASSLVSMSDAEKVAALKRQGWVRGRASGAGANCLIDSLLQLLVASDVVVMPADRNGACEAVRAELIRTPGSEPRDFHSGRVSPRAYLEHFRHAGLVVRALVTAHGSVDRLPAAGVRVVVHARYDRLAGPDDQVRACVGLSSSPGEELRMNLFCLTGDGFAGYHYEPLFWRGRPAAGGVGADAVVLVGDEDEGEGGTADVESVKLLSLQTAAEDDLAAAVVRSIEELAGGGSPDSCAAAASSSRPEAGASESKASQLETRRRTRELRRQTSMAGATEDEEDMERLRGFGTSRDVAERQGREVKRRVGQQLDRTRPLRRSLTNAGDDDLELSENFDRLHLGSAEELLAESVEGSARIVPSSVPGMVGLGQCAQVSGGLEAEEGASGSVSRAAGSRDSGVSAREVEGDVRAALSCRSVRVPRRTEIGDMRGIRAENQYVESEMERRDFQRPNGQWVGGVLLPGDPPDGVDLESFLRRQFQAQQESARVAAWGTGRTLGRN